MSGALSAPLSPNPRVLEAAMKNGIRVSTTDKSEAKA
jgi:hypothetical protein